MKAVIHDCVPWENKSLVSWSDFWNEQCVGYSFLILLCLLDYLLTIFITVSSDYVGELILSCGQGWDVLDATKGFSIGTNFCHFSLWNWPWFSEWTEFQFLEDSIQSGGTFSNPSDWIFAKFWSDVSQKMGLGI